MLFDPEELPDNWLAIPIQDICSFNPKHSKDLNDDLEVAFVPMAAVDATSGTITEQEVRLLKKVRTGYTHFADGDVIFAKITPCMENGKSAVVVNLINGIGCGSTEFHVLRSNGAVIAEYLHRFLRQQSYRDFAAQNMTGVVGQRRVPKQFLLENPIPLPPLNEQHRIVAKIEELTAHSRRSREALDDVPELINQFRQSVLAAAFRGDLTADWREKHSNLETADQIVQRVKERRISEANSSKAEKIEEIYSHVEAEDSEFLPITWNYVALDKLADSFNYGTSQKSSKTGDIPVLRMGNLQGGEIDWSDLVFSSDQEEISKYDLRPNTVLFNRTNSPELVGKTSIYRGEKPAIFAGYLIRINNFDELDPEYLNYALNSDYAKSYCWRVKTDGVSQSNINAQKLGKFEVPFCSLEEQREIVRLLDRYMTSIKTIEEQYQDNYSSLDILDQSILAKAFRGELVPQDPNDEPASVLLERIRAEREKLGSTKKKGRISSKKSQQDSSEQLSL